MKNQNSPETIKIQDQNFGNHVEHWNLLTDTPEVDVPKWLGLALDAPVMPMGLCEDEQDMDQSFWLIQGPSGQNVANVLPRHHWPPPYCFCQSRALTSLAHV